jgi:hypothetical protein
MAAADDKPAKAPGRCSRFSGPVVAAQDLFGGKLDNLDLPSPRGHGIRRFVSQFFKDKAKDEKYLTELKRSDDLGVKMLSS